MKYEVLCMKYEVWSIKYEVWSMNYEVWIMKYELWSMKHKVWSMYQVSSIKYIGYHWIEACDTDTIKIHGICPNSIRPTVLQTSVSALQRRVSAYPRLHNNLCIADYNKTVILLWKFSVTLLRVHITRFMYSSTFYYFFLLVLVMTILTVCLKTTYTFPFHPYLYLLIV